MRNPPGFPMARDTSWHDHRRGQIHAVWWPDGSLDGFGLGKIPKHCPHQSGDWVAMHGHGGRHPYPTWQHGFRGMVLGHMGSTLLRGLTDDGREWCEHWGHLVPDGARERGSVVLCNCCPHSPQKPPRRCVEQGSLFRLDELSELFAGVSAGV